MKHLTTWTDLKKTHAAEFVGFEISINGKHHATADTFWLLSIETAFRLIEKSQGWFSFNLIIIERHAHWNEAPTKTLVQTGC